jgi:hypothetical protein
MVGQLWLEGTKRFIGLFRTAFLAGDNKVVESIRTSTTSGNHVVTMGAAA